MKKILLLLFICLLLYGCKTETLTGTYTDEKYNPTIVYIKMLPDSRIAVTIERWYGNVSDTLFLKKIQ